MPCSPVYGHGHECNGTCGLEHNIDSTSAGDEAEEPVVLTG